MEIAEHVVALDRDGRLLADAAAKAGLMTAIPACPGWQVRDLVRHQAYVHGYLFLWNRCTASDAGITVSGAPGVLDAWRSSVHVRWS